MDLYSCLKPAATGLLAAVLAIGCASTPDAPQDEAPAEGDIADAESEAGDDGEYIVEFRDRNIDLHPYVQGFPYTQLMPDLEQGLMLFFETTPDGKWLKHLQFDDGDEIDWADAQQVNDLDWSTRNFRRGQYNEYLDQFVFMGDEQNDEIFNIYALNIDDGALETLTDVDYTYGYGFSDDHRLMGYVVRHGDSEPFNSCLHIRDFESGDDTELWCDDGGDDRLTWTGVDFADDARSVVVRMQHDGDRSRTNLGRFELDDPDEPQLLLERGVEHLSLWSMRDTYDGDELLYVSSQRGINDVYHLDVESGESRRLTDLEDDISSAVILDNDDAPTLLALALDRPYGTILEIRDPENGALLWQQERPESISFRDDHAGQALLAMSSVDTPFRMEHATLDVADGLVELDDIDADDSAVGIDTRHFASIPDELADDLRQCHVERIEYPTFDDVDGQPRTLHAYLYEPTDPPADSERLARITAFYGGSNAFRSSHQIMCEAGITTLSPAPRGSRGFGAQFAALNDGDLGGDDIVDIIYAARWLEEHRNFEPRQIGVYGSSHGGYATMRALTFPPETNDRDISYPFGFGHSHAGISDLLHFYETSNIPDWLVLLAGDPETETEKLRQRSPLHHVERLDAPLLLTHGSHDSRVPVDESRRFAEAADDVGGAVTYEEFDGQGHGIDGLSNRMRYYRAIFDFLEHQVDPQLGEEAASD